MSDGEAQGPPLWASRLAEICSPIADDSALPWLAIDNVDDSVQYVNQAFCDLLRRVPQEILGQSIGKVLPCDADFLDLLRRTQAAGECVLGLFEFGAQGSRVFVLSPIRIPDSGLMGALLQLTETSEAAVFRQEAAAVNQQLMLSSIREHELRDHAELVSTALRQREQVLRQRTEQLRQTTSELAHAEQRERQRLADLLHDDLQQLLVAAKFHAQAIVPVQSQDNAELIPQVVDLLDLCIKTSRNLATELNPPIFHEGGLILGLEWIARWMQEKYNLKIMLDLDKTCEIRNVELRFVLFQCIRELLLNIVKHAEVDSAVLRLRRKEQLQISIEDEGVGFTPDRSQNHSFGLRQVAERLKSWNCGLHMTSSPGAGTQATIIIPVSACSFTKEEVHPDEGRSSARSLSQREPKLPAEVAAPAGALCRVMLVEDHAAMRSALVRALQNEPDMEVVGQAVDGESALATATESKPDVILMDVTLPGMSGVEATRLLNSHFPGVKIIGLSLCDEMDFGHNLRAAGAVDFVNKAEPYARLIGAIRAATTVPC